MYSLKISIYHVLYPMLAALALTSCSKNFDEKDYSAHFSGEIINPTSNYVLFCKEDIVIDTLFLDQNNHFSKRFDSLSPGMYLYRHNPEFQYVYFDKNDSINLRLNTRDFDHSVLFSGRGEQKNNFLMLLNNKNLVDRNKLYEYYDSSVDEFIKKVDSTHAVRTTLYLRNKASINWSKEFDLYAKTMLDLHFYSQKEIYPIAHHIRNQKDIRKELPQDYYDFRKRIDFNNENLIDFSSFTRYLGVMLSSEVEQSEIEFNSETNFDKNIEKLNIIDTLISNEKVKNTILDKIAFIYLLDDQNITNNELFLNRYFEISTDKDQHNEITKIQHAIQNIQEDQRLPDVPLMDIHNQLVSINELIDKPTLIFFWSKYALAHLDAAHQKAIGLLQNNPELQIVAVNIDSDQEDWLNQIQQYKDKNLVELRAKDFIALKDQWIITKIQRAIILNSDGSIYDAFVNLFDTAIEHKLKAVY